MRMLKEVALGFICLMMLLAFNLISVSAEAPEGALNVKDYGAVGDGVTNDLEAIQSAIDDAAEGMGGGTVYFPEGTYLVEEIVVLKSNITLYLDDNAVILNGINQSGHPSIVFMTGPFTEDGEQVVWEDTENITIIGGTIDMNGELNEAGDGCKNLPNIGSSGAFALGFCDNVTIKNVTFLNSYKGHAIQICACDGVLIDNCTFLGQALPNTLSDSSIISLETVQIEPATQKGFPYSANEEGECSQNITIQNCYFGASDICGEPVTAIGTHNQVTGVDKCNNINILNNTFDNMVYAGVRFCGYEDVLIEGNTFTKKAEADCVNYRSSGCFLVNAYCYNNQTEELDLNKNITINNNTFYIADYKTRGIRVAKDNANYLGDVSNITISNNTIQNTSTESTDVGIQALRISDNLTITGNKINGGYRGIEMQYCTGSITVNANTISGCDYQYVRFITGGDNQKLSFYTHGSGTFEISTADGEYTFTAVPNSGYAFVAYYKENALTTWISDETSLKYSVSESTSTSRHALFDTCTGGNHLGSIQWVQTETTHKQVCDLCNEDVTSEENHQWDNGVCTVCGYSCVHSGGTATCINKAVCEICGQEYGELAEHSYGDWTITKEATATEDGVRSKTCTVCGDTVTETIAAGTCTDDNHLGTIQWIQTETTHKQVCDLCNEDVTNEEEHQWDNGVCTVCGYSCVHSGGTATCTDKAVCEICGQEYGELAEHSYGDWTITKEATATEDGSRSKTCTVCGDTVTETIAATGETESGGTESEGSDSDDDASSTDDSATDSESSSDNSDAELNDVEVTDTGDAGVAEAEVIESPHTGDSSNLFLWAALLVIVAVGSSGVVLLRKGTDKNVNRD